MMRRSLVGLWFLIAFLQASTAAAEVERLALVIGNAEYGSVGALRNASNDARLIADALTTAGFEVNLLVDGTLVEMGEAIADFGRQLRTAGDEATGLFYFAGHGVQSFGENFILPTDVALSDAADLGIVAVEIDSVIRQMRSAGNQTNIIIIDACRNNPFGASLDPDENGLAEMDAPSGSFIAMATAPGAVAVDGRGEHSPFSEALAREILVPDQSIEETFRNVRIAVSELTGGRQTPWDTSSLLLDFAFVRAVQLPEIHLEDTQVGASNWAAVAVNTSSGMYGLATGDDTPESANVRAMDFCEGFSEGIPGCEIVLSTSVCGAVAVGQGRFFVVEASSPKGAGEQALARCREQDGAACTLDSTFCGAG
jgi:hypothetical protein